MLLQRQVAAPGPSRGLSIPNTLIAGAIVAAALLGIGGLVFGPRVIRSMGNSKQDLARSVTKQYVYAAYPSWLARHPAKLCPMSLSELAPYMSRSVPHDPWGSQYRLACNERGLLVVSPGEDGKLGTADDIRSDR